MSHGDCGSKEHVAWRSLKYRCSNPSYSGYHNYGGRGIKVCERWVNSYENFLEDMGRAPTPKHSLDRIDNNGDYEPSNCRWATSAEQSNNRNRNVMLTYNGKTQTVKMWCEELGVRYDPVRRRMKILGWSPDEAFNKPIRKLNKKVLAPIRTIT